MASAVNDERRTPQYHLRFSDAGQLSAFGAQARVHGLMTEFARRHDLTAVMAIDGEFDVDTAEAIVCGGTKYVKD